MAVLLVIYVFCLLATLYALAFALKRYKPIKNYKGALLAFAFMAMFGPVGEILVGSIYSFMTQGAYLWEYKILPVHNGYTSYIAPLIWGVAGVYTHLFWGHFAAIKNRWLKYGVLALDTLFVEITLNGLFLLLFKNYVFYYHPGDLWHLSSVQTLPFYLIAAIVTVRAIRYSALHPRFYSLLFLAIAGVVTYLA